MSSESLRWKYAALFSYVGTDYCGWQRQLGTDSGDAPSIQGTIMGALLQLTGEDASVVGSGRTDSGVHAVGQMAHFSLARKEWDPRILHKGLNSILPQDIQVIAVRFVPSDFHAQRSAEKKQYSYYFQQGECALPHLEPYTWWRTRYFDLEAMKRAVSHLRGEHDFKGFQGRGSKELKSTVRKILEADVTWEPVPFPLAPYSEKLGLVRVRLVGTGFLKQMVRSICGTLREIGEGRRDPDDIRKIIETKNRSLVGPTAPPRGLWLERVWYPERFGAPVAPERKVPHAHLAGTP